MGAPLAARLAAAASVHVVAETALLRRLGAYAYLRAGVPRAQPSGAALVVPVVQLAARSANGCGWHALTTPFAVAMSARGLHGQRCGAH
jgi:hypothetical protein